MSTFGARLKKRLDLLGIEPKDLAEKMGVQVGRVYQLTGPHNDNVELETLFKLAKILRCSIESFCEGSDPEYDAMMATDLSMERCAHLLQRIALKPPPDAQFWWQALKRLAEAPIDAKTGASEETEAGQALIGN